MNNTLTFALPLILLCLSSPASSAQDIDNDPINKFISNQATRERGQEYEDARKVIAGDLNHDSTPDLAVLYTIEGQNGTNNYVQYLAVFLRVKGRLLQVTHTAVGGKSYRAVELQSIRNNVIVFKTLNYGANDAACCPSKERVARYVLVNRKLKQL